MKILLKKISIRELVEGYKNSDEDGVVGCYGKLDIRPKYQREFIYKDKQRDSVIGTVRKFFPINIMYWVKNKTKTISPEETLICDEQLDSLSIGEYILKNPTDTFEILDGQQRTISICEYVKNKFSINYQKFINLTQEEQDQILDYELLVYICEGDEREKLEWFQTINIAGVKLTDQELRNAVYTGTWLTDAKKYFSKTSCAAFNIGSNYVTGTPIKQDYLEAVLSWISSDHTDKDLIKGYMSLHQHDADAEALWDYYQCVINWIARVYPPDNYRKEMKSVNWGILYNRHKLHNFNAKKLEIEIVKLMQDEDVSNKKGIYSYLLDGNERQLSVRSFNDRMKREAYERQKGICTHCQDNFDLSQMEADHITPWSKGGRTNSDNCQMLCQGCNRTKSDI